jgi:hypothetical protein
MFNISTGSKFGGHKHKQKIVLKVKEALASGEAKTTASI